jgi:hypothetical protein
MRQLEAAATLDLWQAAEGRPPVERALVLAAVDGEEPAEVAHLMLGRRDARLLDLHAALGGRLLEATATCPACGEPAELCVDPAELAAVEDRATHPGPIEVDGFVVSWRPLDSDDLLAAAEADDAASAERVLLSRCVLAAARSAGEVAATDLPQRVRDALERALPAADPLSEVLVGVACPACATDFVVDLDVAGFVWAELRARARSLLREVHVLARAYGWTEREVLALGERRRTAYLELAEELA